MLVSSSALFHHQALDKGWVLDLESIPATANWPAEYRDKAVAVVGLGPATIAYNTNLVKKGEEPKGWQDLADPKWKGQLLLVDPRNAESGLANWWLLLQTYGVDLLKGVAANQPQLVDSNVPGTQQIAAGSAAVLMSGLHTVTAPLQAQGAPVDEVYPEPSTGPAWGASVASRAPHPNAARLLYTYYLTREGQMVVNKTASSPLGQLPGTQPLPKNFQMNDLQGAAAHRDTILAALGLS
jgi:iron(III) transport system substrate-binding protein